MSYKTNKEQRLTLDDHFLNANEQTKKFVLSFWKKVFSEIVFPAINEDGASFMGIIYQTNKKQE